MCGLRPSLAGQTWLLCPGGVRLALAPHPSTRPLLPLPQASSVDGLPLPPDIKAAARSYAGLVPERREQLCRDVLDAVAVLQGGAPVLGAAAAPAPPAAAQAARGRARARAARTAAAIQPAPVARQPAEAAVAGGMPNMAHADSRTQRTQPQAAVEPTQDVQLLGGAPAPERTAAAAAAPAAPAGAAAEPALALAQEEVSGAAVPAAANSWPDGGASLAEEWDLSLEQQRQRPFQPPDLAALRRPVAFMVDIETNSEPAALRGRAAGCTLYYRQGCASFVCLDWASAAHALPPHCLPLPPPAGIRAASCALAELAALSVGGGAHLCSLVALPRGAAWTEQNEAFTPHITADKLAGAPPFEALYPQLVDLMRREVEAAGPGAYPVLVGHNAKGERGETGGGMGEGWVRLQGAPRLLAPAVYTTAQAGRPNRHPTCSPRPHPCPFPQSLTCPCFFATPRSGACPSCAPRAGWTRCPWRWRRCPPRAAPGSRPTASWARCTSSTRGGRPTWHTPRWQTASTIWRCSRACWLRTACS